MLFESASVFGPHSYVCKNSLAVSALHITEYVRQVTSMHTVHGVVNGELSVTLPQQFQHETKPQRGLGQPRV